ncbi:unnamed protein product [Peniophora sp. CBMAI 1063]|nr:unnamed protein product [Peniophora sp. CBMAI 1063]
MLCADAYVQVRVTRVILEVGSQGILGGQVVVTDVEGELQLTRDVNRICSSLTDQVRSIAGVPTAVARGDLTQKVDIQVEGELATLKTTVNSVVDQFILVNVRVTRVALEVGTQGILGGQARVEDVQGTWADLTRNVNKMASNLSHSVRSISEVTKAVAMGDLGRLVGTEGILGGQAYVADVQGMWKVLAGNAILMATNLTD